MQSAERSTERENTNPKVQVRHYFPELILYRFPAPDSLPLLHARRFHETDPRATTDVRRVLGARTGREGRGRKERFRVKLRINAKQSGSRLQPNKPPLCVSLLSAEKRKQGWCVDYKYNPLIISVRMEEFDERGKEPALNSNRAGVPGPEKEPICPKHFLPPPSFLQIRKLH